MWKTMLKPKIIIGFQTTEATLFCRERCLGLLFCRGDARFINLSLKNWIHFILFPLFKRLCVRAHITLNASEPNLLVLPVRVWQIGSIYLTTESFSWRTWRQHCIVYCYLSPLKTALKPTSTFSHCRKWSFTWKQVAEEESKDHALIQVSLHSMNFPSTLSAINDPTSYRK